MAAFALREVVRRTLWLTLTDTRTQTQTQTQACAEYDGGTARIIAVFHSTEKKRCKKKKKRALFSNRLLPC